MREEYLMMDDVLEDYVADDDSDSYEADVAEPEDNHHEKLSDWAYLTSTNTGKKPLSREDEVAVFQDMEKYRKKLFSHILNYHDLRSKVREDITSALEKRKKGKDDEEYDLSGKKNQGTLVTIVYMRGKELKDFRKRFKEYTRKEKHEELASLLKSAEYMPEYYDIIIDYSRDKRPDIYKRSKNLEQALTELVRSEEKILAHNLRLIINRAKKYFRRPHDMEFLDIYQEGVMGLMRGIRRFDYKRGYKTSTFVTHWIKQGMSRGIDDKGRTIRIPVHMIESARKYKRERSEIEEIIGREPTDDEMARRMNMSLDKIHALKSILRHDIVSLSSLAWEAGDTELHETLKDTHSKSPEAIADDRATFQDIMQKLEERLPAKELEVLKQRYMEGKTLEEIGCMMKLTRERIRQIESRAIRRARNYLIQQGFEVDFSALSNGRGLCYKEHNK